MAVLHVHVTVSSKKDRCGVEVMGVGELKKETWLPIARRQPDRAL